MTLSTWDTIWVLGMFVISLVMIVVNERYSTGVPKSWLSSGSPGATGWVTTGTNAEA